MRCGNVVLLEYSHWSFLCSQHAEKKLIYINYALTIVQTDLLVEKLFSTTSSKFSVSITCIFALLISRLNVTNCKGFF